jgi:hypothetical protein
VPRKRETQTLVIEGGTVKAMYTETGPIDVRMLGDIKKAKKVSDVKFDPKMQSWVAIDRKSKKVVAKDRSRAGCVLKEHAHYEKEISRGKPPW